MITEVARYEKEMIKTDRAMGELNHHTTADDDSNNNNNDGDNNPWKKQTTIILRKTIRTNTEN